MLALLMGNCLVAVRKLDIDLRLGGQLFFRRY
jgi:hypothetical protein